MVVWKVIEIFITIFTGVYDDEGGSTLRPKPLLLLDFCITQLEAQGPSRTCNESKEEEEASSLLLSSLRRFIHRSMSLKYEP